MAEQEKQCCKCKTTESIWSFKTESMQKKIYLCWEHLQEVEAKVAERGKVNIYN